MSANALMLDRIKLMSWLDRIKEAIAGFQGFTHTLSRLSRIVSFKSISDFTSVGRGLILTG